VQPREDVHRNESARPIDVNKNTSRRVQNLARRNIVFSSDYQRFDCGTICIQASNIEHCDRKKLKAMICRLQAIECCIVSNLLQLGGDRLVITELGLRDSVNLKCA
jgi:hypothetical protein